MKLRHEEQGGLAASRSQEIEVLEMHSVPSMCNVQRTKVVFGMEEG